MPNLLDAPIPGQSLTKEPKSSKMEHPPRFVKVGEALDYSFDKFTEKKHSMGIVLLLKQGVPCEYIARTFLTAGLFEGLWTVDVMLLMADKVTYMLYAIGQANQVKNLKMKNPDKGEEQFLSKFLDVMDTPEVVKETTKANGLFSGLGA